MRDGRRLSPAALTLLMLATVPGAPLRSHPDAPDCDRCGKQMTSDASGDMWLCANPLCGWEPPATPTRPEEGAER